MNCPDHDYLYAIVLHIRMEFELLFVEGEYR